MVDTQLFLRAALNPKSLPAKIIISLHDSYQLLISAASYAEVSEVLSRPRIRARYPHLSDPVIERILALYSASEWIDVGEVVPVSRDPKDDIFLACAVAGNADYIVTEDQDLLVLNPYLDIQIVTALDFLRVLESPPPGRE